MKKLVCLVLIIVMNFGFVGVSYGEEKCEYVEGERYSLIYSANYSKEGDLFVIGTNNYKEVELSKNGKTLGKYKVMNDFITSHYNTDFAFVSSDGDKNFVIKNGIKQKSYTGSIGGLTFSRDGSRLGYSVTSGYQTYIRVINDNEEVTEYPDISNYIEEKGKGIYNKNNVYYINKEQVGFVFNLIKSGEIVESYDKILYSEISSDGKKFIFIAEKDGIELVNINGKEVLIGDGNIIYGSYKFFYDNSNDYSFYGVDYADNQDFDIGIDNADDYDYGEKYFVFMNGMKKYLPDDFSYYGFKKVGQNDLMVGLKGGNKYLFKNGIKQGEYQNYIKISKSYFGDHYAYIGEDYINTNLYIDGYKTENYNDINQNVLQFSPVDDKLLFKAFSDDFSKSYIVERICTGTNQTNTITSTKTNLKPKPSLTRQYILSKSKIKKLQNGELIITKLDEFIDKYMNNKEFLNKIYTKLGEMRSKISDEDKLILIDYLEGKIGLKIYKGK